MGPHGVTVSHYSCMSFITQPESDSVLIPQPDSQPTMRLWPDAGRALGLSRSATYQAAQRGDLPTIRIGGRLLVPTAALRRLLSMDV